MNQDFDVAVIGLGAMGAHAVQQLAARGASVIGIERFGPLNDRGSSHGDSRLIRLGYFEDPAYVPLLRRAFANWRALEARSHEALLTITGVVQIGRPGGVVVGGALASCRQFGLAHEVLEREAAERRFPAFNLRPGDVALFEAEGGFLKPERAITAALKLAGEDGAVLHFNERVTAIEPGAGGVTVVSTAGHYRARKVIVAAGSYVAGLLPALAPFATPIKQVVGWYPARDRLATAVGRMPGFLVDEDEGGTYFGFPDLGEGVKVGKHFHFHEEIDPEQPNPPINAADRAATDQFMARRMPGVVPTGSAFVSCRYTMLPDEVFLIDTLPGERDIIVASPCSGHGFKFASVVGEILADLAIDGETKLPIELFSFAAMQARGRRAEGGTAPGA